MRVAAVFLLTLACTPAEPAAIAPPTTATTTATATASSPTPTTPRRWEARKDGVTALTISNQPGYLIDGNAPPPPPGQPPAKHPFLSATCVARDPLLCSHLGDLLRASHSLDDFLAKLGADGLEIVELRR